MNEWFTIIGMMAVTFGVRYPVLALAGKIPLPGPIFRALKYVPPAVLTAIVIPSMLMPDGTIQITLDNAPLAAGIIAGLVAWRSQKLLLTIVSGMLALWVWTWLLG